MAPRAPGSAAPRQETLDVQVGADPVQTLVTGSSYLPSSPLTSLALSPPATDLVANRPDDLADK